MKTRSKSIAGLVLGCALVAASCSSGDDAQSDTTDAPTDSTAADSTTADDTAADETSGSSSETVDSEEQVSDSTESAAPTEATGDPIRVGVQNPEGDPAGSLPEYSIGIQAAADYVNAELGGLGGRPIEIVLCKNTITPDDSQRCANELAADDIEMAISTVNYFGNHFSIYQGSDIPVFVGTAVTIGDFTSEGVYAIGAGGGCLGSDTAAIQFITDQLEDLEDIQVERVAVPWSDNPAGGVCYNDLLAKPLDVINGSEPGDSARAGERPDLVHLGVPILPAAPDVTPQATEVLEFEPDAIEYSSSSADCWNFVDALGRLGWTPDDVPLVMAGCVDFAAMRAAGNLATGVYFVGSSNSLLSPLDSLEGDRLEDATTYQTKGPEYGMSDEEVSKTFASAGFALMMSIWDNANKVEGDVTGQTIADVIAATDGTETVFGGTSLDCSGAPEPYISVCASESGMSQWDGEQLVAVVEPFTGIDLVAGTQLRTS